MFKKKAVCQSCAMPLSQDPEGGGTHADGSKSDTYCSYCYAEGVFTQPSITMEEMREQVKDRLKDQYRIPNILRTHFTRGIPKLKRWKK